MEMKQVEDIREFMKKSINGADTRTANEIEVLSKRNNLTELEKQYLKLLKEHVKKYGKEENNPN